MRLSSRASVALALRPKSREPSDRLNVREKDEVYKEEKAWRMMEEVAEVVGGHDDGLWVTGTGCEDCGSGCCGGAGN